MEKRRLRKARMLVTLAVERLDCVQEGDASMPSAGDIVELDQGFTGADGKPMGIVVCRSEDGIFRWSAEVFDTEIELIG
jgi:phage protein D